MMNRFLQIHTLTSYPAALLNRDDVGFAKRLPFGGASRTRVSSQCLKRHWRTFEGESSIGAIQIGGAAAPLSVRSRQSFDRYVYEPIVAAGIDPALADAVTQELVAAVLGESAKAKKEKAEAKGEKGKGKGKKGKAADPEASRPAEREPIHTNQVTVLGKPELDFLAAEGIAIARASNSADEKDVEKAVAAHLTKDRRENLKTLRLGAGLDAALFGRMVTSDVLARGDAALHVAHAFTVHAEESESDYFSAVDDLLKDTGELGSGHINSAELTSGLYYGYVVVDVPLLVSNLEGCDRKAWTSADRTLAAEVVRRVMHLVATVSPGAKLGSTAPYAYAHMVLAESGNAQPRTLANAFLSPVRPAGDLLASTYAALAEHVQGLDAMYGSGTTRRLASVKKSPALDVLGADRGTLAEVASWAAAQVGS